MSWLGELLCKWSFHSHKSLFYGCPQYFNGVMYGSSCKRCGKLIRKYDTLFSRPKSIPMDYHVIISDMPVSQMTNREKQFYLRNVNNLDKRRPDEK